MKLPGSLLTALKAAVVCSAVCGPAPQLSSAEGEDGPLLEAKQAPIEAASATPTPHPPRDPNNCLACGRG